MSEEFDIELNPTGITQFVGVDSQLATLKRMEEMIEFHVKARTHMWTAVVLYYLADSTLEYIQEGNMSLDSENLLGTPGIGCYLCEKPFNKREMKRKCKGMA